MAIVQISRITHRKGLQENLPQLEGGELGWSTDSQRLFIGNGTTGAPPTGDGAPTIGNTEILTEHSDIFSAISNYTYRGDEAGYTVQTGANANNDIERTLQHKLDDIASIRDFGAVGDGQTDDTAAINRALYQLFCRDNTELSRRSIFFPAGDYLITSTILIPPYAKLVGEGLDSTVIRYNPPEWSETETYTRGSGVIKSSGTNSGRYVALLDVPAGTSTGDTTYWAPVDGVAVRTADNNQESGGQNGINSKVSSRYNDIQNLTFRSDAALSTTYPVTIAQVESAIHCTFKNVGFKGPATSISTLGTNSGASTVAQNYPDMHCVQLKTPLRSDSTTQITRGITFDACYFSGQSCGIYAEDDVQGITFSNSGFETLYYGVHLAVAAGTDGPSGIRVLHNRFDDIYHNAVLFDDVQKNVCCYNMFETCSNANTVFGVGDGWKQPVVYFTNGNNVSVGDMFLRTDAQALVSPRIDIGNSESYALVMSERMSFGSYNRDVGVTATLTDGSSGALFTKDAWPNSSDVGTGVLRSFKMNYTIYRGTYVRTGVLTVVSSISDGSSTTLSYEDDYHENATTGITLEPSQSGEDVSVLYTCSSTGDDAIIRYSLEYMTSSGAF